MAVKKWMLLLLLTLLPTAALALDEGRTYVIRKGDTLWGISERFIKDPYYWPSLWSHNPAITNPHFIYPGQEVRLVNGRLEIVPAARQETPPPATEPAPASEVPPPATAAEPSLPPAPPEALTVRIPGIEGFISADELAAAGRIIDAVDNRIMLTAGDVVFAEMAQLDQVRPEDRFSLFHRGEEVRHPVTGEKLGFRVTDVGTLEVREVNTAVITGLITSSTREVQRGTLLLSWQPPVKEIALKQASQPVTGYVVAGGGGQLALGQNDIVYLDLGAEHGLEVGNLLYISRPRRSSDISLREDLPLPDVLLGSAVVIDVQSRTASALVLKSAGALQHGDRVTAAVE